MCIRDRYQRRVHGDPYIKSNENSQREFYHCDTEKHPIMNLATSVLLISLLSVSLASSPLFLGLGPQLRQITPSKNPKASLTSNSSVEKCGPAIIAELKGLYDLFGIDQETFIKGITEIIAASTQIYASCPSAINETLQDYFAQPNQTEAVQRAVFDFWVSLKEIFSTNGTSLIRTPLSVYYIYKSGVTSFDFVTPSVHAFRQVSQDPQCEQLGTVIAKAVQSVIDTKGDVWSAILAVVQASPQALAFVHACYQWSFQKSIFRS
eukprot:TRINITY_DN9698_c0_g3_i3.p1 TRINITY_DN9698_c0_g3~~TRINITY_DN9698_c0_g3_i3.p1  ORF type:complete len:264 (+),score=57.78 TRINITY_DN9698_c0_g3_i3:104-895(+)